jgi:23S rRNA pseudouridine2605 synthase
MRINRFVALSTGMSRRAADTVIQDGRVRVDGQQAEAGTQAEVNARVTLDGKLLKPPTSFQTIILNKPEGYVVSRDGQGSKTIYELLPPDMSPLKPVGRLDKDSSGLLVLTNDGGLSNQLTHPSFYKIKNYEVTLDKPLQPLHHQMISDMGIRLKDGPSKLQLDRLKDGDDNQWKITMHEGRNRQIRRTFDALGYTVTKLHRTDFGDYHLGDLTMGSWRAV